MWGGEGCGFQRAGWNGAHRVVCNMRLSKAPWTIETMLHSTDSGPYCRDLADGEIILVVFPAEMNTPHEGLIECAFDRDLDLCRVLEPPYGLRSGIGDYVLTGRRAAFLPELFKGSHTMRRIEGCRDVEGLTRWEPDDDQSEARYVGRYHFPDGSAVYVGLLAVDHADARSWHMKRRSVVRDMFMPGGVVPQLNIKTREMPLVWEELGMWGRSTMLSTLW